MQVTEPPRNPGRFCARIRLRSRSGTQLAEQTGCSAATAVWQQLPAAALTAAASGSVVDIDLSAVGARTGHTFDADGITLTQT